MSDKRNNVHEWLFGVFKPRKTCSDDIIMQADKVIENYIFDKNKLIHRKCKKVSKSERMFPVFMTAAVIAAATVLFKIIL